MKCVNCGFTWKEGVGAHECQQVKDARYERLRQLSRRAKILLDEATFHDGQYDQHTSARRQKEACIVSDRLAEALEN